MAREMHPAVRMVPLLLGGLLALYGLRRPSPLGLCVMLVGGGLLGYGATRRPTGPVVARNGAPYRDAVDDSSESSFPASDPAAWTAQR